MTLADLVLAAASEPHVRAPLACRRKVAREGILEPAPFTPPSPDRVRAITSPDEPSRIVRAQEGNQARGVEGEALKNTAPCGRRGTARRHHARERVRAHVDDSRRGASER